MNNNTSYHPYLRRVLLHSYDYDYNYEWPQPLLLVSLSLSLTTVSAPHIIVFFSCYEYLFSSCPLLSQDGHEVHLTVDSSDKRNILITQCYIRRTSSYVGHQVASNEASLLGVRSISFPLKRDPTSFRIRGKRGKNIQSHVCRSSFWLHGCQEQVSTKEQALIARQVFPPLPLSDPPMGVRRVLNNALLSLRGKCIKSIHTVRDKEILKNEDVFFLPFFFNNRAAMMWEDSKSLSLMYRTKNSILSPYLSLFIDKKKITLKKDNGEENSRSALLNRS